MWVRSGNHRTSDYRRLSLHAYRPRCGRPIISMQWPAFGIGTYPTTSLAAHYSFRNGSGSFATLAAIRRASV